MAERSPSPRARYVRLRTTHVSAQIAKSARARPVQAGSRNPSPEIRHRNSTETGTPAKKNQQAGFANRQNQEE